MAFYQFEKKLFMPVSKEKVWDFISSPKNLKLITPEYMGFDILNNDLNEKMYPGMIVSYHVKPITGFKTLWVTEITHVVKNEYFVDEQRIGPYSMWHHEHILRKIENGVEMIDIVSYKPPLGIAGAIANKLFIHKQLNKIFEFREKALKKIFNF